VDNTVACGGRSFSEMDLRETFQVFDKDEDGFLNAADLRLVLSISLVICIIDWSFFAVGCVFWLLVFIQ
jgi:Ca2+-binding EF-hand superfamily protein